MLDHLLVERRDVVGVGIVPGEMQAGSLQRYWKMLGTRDFVKTGTGLAAFKAMNLASRVLPLSRSYSVAGAARRHDVPCEPVEKVNGPAFVESLRARGVDLIVSVVCPQVMSASCCRCRRWGRSTSTARRCRATRGSSPRSGCWRRASRRPESRCTGSTRSSTTARSSLQRPVAIEADDTVHSLVHRSKIEVGKHVLVEAIAAIERGDAARVPMDHAAATYFSYPDPGALREFRGRGRRFI